MKLIFVCHGDPDYKNDSLTEKGWKEAKLLAERISKWDVTDFYRMPDKDEVFVTSTKAPGSAFPDNEPSS